MLSSRFQSISGLYSQSRLMLGSWLPTCLPYYFAIHVLHHVRYCTHCVMAGPRQFLRSCVRLPPSAPLFPPHNSDVPNTAPAWKRLISASSTAGCATAAPARTTTSRCTVPATAPSRATGTILSPAVSPLPPPHSLPYFFAS